MNKRLLTGIAAVGWLTLGSMTPMGAQNRGFGQTAPGTVCKPTNELQADYYQYIGSELANVGTQPRDVFVAACPVRAVMGSGVDLLQYSIVLRDPLQRDARCAIFSGSSTEREPIAHLAADDWNGPLGIFTGAPLPGMYREFEYGSIVNFVAHCLIFPGASIVRIELLWLYR